MEHQATRVLESCHSTWLFDDENLMFCRVIKTDHSLSIAASEWTAFCQLEFEEGTDSFVVWLNEDGTRRLRSWRHLDHCDSCGGEATTELDLTAIASLKTD